MFRVCEQMLQCPTRPMHNLERKWKSNVEIAPNCPRCASANTKFCYYNNYSLSQPRYFCKACRRYWTKGGSLRNVPVGGGCRKSRRARSSTTRIDRASTAHLPFSYNTKSTTTFTTTSPDDGDSAGDQPGPPASGADIDLAVVFAKFLNQAPAADGKSPDEANIEGVDQDDAVWSCLEHDSTNSCSQIDSSSVPEPYAMLQEMPQINDQSMLESTDHHHVNAFGLTNDLLPDHDEIVLHDAAAALWPSDHHDHAATTTTTALTPHFDQWQHIDHSFPDDIDHDQLRISATDNWSCFDLSGFGIFSRP